MSEIGILEMVGRLGVMAAEVAHMEHHALETACQLIEDEARRVVGTYSYGWPQLAQSTQEERTRIGYTPNDPLLRSGDLQASIQHQVEGRTGYVGSNDIHAVYNFLGTRTIPARDPILGAVMHIGDQVQAEIGQVFVAWLSGRGQPPIARIR